MEATGTTYLDFVNKREWLGSEASGGRRGTGARRRFGSRVTLRPIGADTCVSIGASPRKDGRRLDTRERVLHQRGQLSMSDVHTFVDLADPVFVVLHRVYCRFFGFLSPHMLMSPHNRSTCTNFGLLKRYTKYVRYAYIDML